MQNYVDPGITITVAAPYNVASGAGCKVGVGFGVAAVTALSGASVDLTVFGVFDLVKDASTFTDGAVAYWDDTAKAVTSTVGSNLKIGIVNLAMPDGSTILGALTGDATVRVRIFPH